MISDDEKSEILDCLNSAWLTTGPRTKLFEQNFSEVVGSKHAIAVNSCTAAMHLVVEAVGLRPGQGVLVPTMTFAATAEIVVHMGGIPILVDCDPSTLNMDLNDADLKIKNLRLGKTPLDKNVGICGIIPVHVGGFMSDMDEISDFAKRHGLWVIEDAAHALPASYRSSRKNWVRCGEGTAAITCYSFYANKTMTTGEGGMAVTNNGELAERIRCMALHGLSNDAWNRYRGGNWDYQIIAAGYKYNMTDIAASIGIHQLKRIEQFRKAREAIAIGYLDEFQTLECFVLPTTSEDRIHSWHLFPYN